MFKWLKRQPPTSASTPTKRNLGDTLTDPDKAMRVYIISGNQPGAYKEPSYSTDLRAYGIRLKADVTDEEYEKTKATLKAFVNRDDAIDFAYHCNLDSVMCPVYDRLGDKWKFNEAETSRMADDIN